MKFQTSENYLALILTANFNIKSSQTYFNTTFVYFNRKLLLDTTNILFKDLLFYLQ